MKLIELRDRVKAGFNPVVCFREDIGDLETYFEEGMRARLVKIDKTYDDHCGFVFDCTEFDKVNVHLESANYYDEHGNPCLTARQANQYNPIEELYLMYNDDSETFFEIIEEDVRSQLFTEYLLDTSVDVTYVEWLEIQLLKERS